MKFKLGFSQIKKKCDEDDDDNEEYGYFDKFYFGENSRIAK